MFVHPDARRAVARTEPDLRDMHLDQFVIVIGTAVLMEPATRRPLDIVQRIGDLFHRVFMEMIKLEEDGSFPGL